MTLWHPRKRTLRRYTAGEAGGRVEQHVASCGRCTLLLDQETNPSEVLVAALSDIVAPRPGFSEELAPNVISAVRERRTIGLIAELFGAGIDTAAMLLEWEDDRDND